jgi:hypothetical protein
LSNSDKDQYSPGENINLSIGNETTKKNSRTDETNYFEDKMLSLMKYQAKCIGQIRDIMVFLLIVVIIIIIVTLFK